MTDVQTTAPENRDWSKLEQAAERRPEAPGTEHVIRIPFHQLIASPTNPRKTRDPQADAELAQSIKDNAARGGPGILEPLLCRVAEGENKYEVVAGNRRLVAARKAGLDDVPCIVRLMNDAEALEVQIVENLQRKNIEPIEEARGLKFLSATMTVEKIAKRIGKSPTYVYGALKLCELIGPAQKAMESQGLTAGHAVQIARLPAAEQGRVLEALYPPWRKNADEPGLSVRELGKHLQRVATIPLRAATFDTTDPALVAGATPCKTCPNRTGNNPSFTEFPPNNCADRACFDRKTDAGIEAAITKAGKTKTVLFQLKELGDYTDKIPTPGAVGYYPGQFKVAGKSPRFDFKTCKAARFGIYIEGFQKGQKQLVCVDRSCKTHWPQRGGNARPDNKGRKLADQIKYRAMGYALDAAFTGKPSLAGLEVTKIIFRSIHSDFGFNLNQEEYRAMKGKTIDRIRPLLTGDLPEKNATQEQLVTATLALIGMFAGVSGLHPERFKKRAAAEIKAETANRPQKPDGRRKDAKAAPKAKPTKKPKAKKTAKSKQKGK